MNTQSPAAAGTVLVVEDDPGVARLEQKRLERAGFAVRAAATAEEALDHLRQEDISLILLDYRLPGGIDGLTFYREVKAAGFNIPVILVTGFGNEAIVIQALRVGVRDFVTKSTEYLDYLPEAVQRVLRQVQTERRLAESEARLSSVIDSAKEAILVADEQRRLTLFNHAAEQMFRCHAGEALGKPVERFLDWESLEQSPLGEGGYGQARNGSPERCGIRMGGERFPAEISISRARIDRTVFYTIVVRDITERRRAEEALRRSEERFQTFMDHSPALAYIKDEDGRYLYVSRLIERDVGRKVEDVIGQTDAELWPAMAPRLREHDLETLARGHSLEFDEQLPGAAGSPTHWLAVKFPYQVEHVRLLGGVAINITGQRQIEEQFRHSQKMEAIGQLAGGIAHDFNNLLTGILGYCELSLLRPVPPEVRRDIQEIRALGERATTLTQQLLAFSRRQPMQPVVFEVSRLVEETSKVLRRIIGEHIDLRLSAPADVGNVRADPGQIEQVLMNLAVNARDAMPSGGQLVIELSEVKLEANDSEVSGKDLPRGEYVRIVVRDTGSGMAPETQRRIFEPFFTTKAIGKGTGLGLSTVYGIIRQHGGLVRVESKLGEGTTFTIYLPRVHEAPGAASRGSSIRILPNGSETILLVEDEESVRQIARRILEARGYKVLVAATPEQARALFQSNGGEVRLLVTDVLLPGMTGPQLLERLRRQTPDLRVLYISGYPDDSGIYASIVEQKTPFLPKPFDQQALSEKVREVLDAPPPKAVPAASTSKAV